MSMRLFAVLFTAFFLIGISPLFVAHSFGLQGAGITAGFVTPVQDFAQAAIFIGIGLLSAWLRSEAVLLVPLGAVVMLGIGSLMEINEQEYPAMHGFILGGIILFSLSLSMLRRRKLLLYLLPVSVWAYYCGAGFMGHVPAVTTPLFFLIGALTGSILLMAMGVAAGVALADRIDDSTHKLKMSGAFASFLSLF